MWSSLQTCGAAVRMPKAPASSGQRSCATAMWSFCCTGLPSDDEESFVGRDHSIDVEIAGQCGELAIEQQPLALRIESDRAQITAGVAGKDDHRTVAIECQIVKLAKRNGFTGRERKRDIDFGDLLTVLVDPADFDLAVRPGELSFHP